MLLAVFPVMPVEVYESPRTEFVAGFLGETNVFDEGGRRVAVRPERMELHRPGAGAHAGAIAQEGEIREIVYLGDRVHAVVTLDSGREVLVALRDHGVESSWHRGDSAMVTWNAADARPLEADG